MEGNHLVLTEKLHPTFQANAEYHFCEYTLLEAEDINFNELLSLMNDGEEAEIEINHYKVDSVLTISTIKKQYQFFSRKIEQNFRKYSYEELKELVVTFEKSLNNFLANSTHVQGKFDKIYTRLGHEIKLRTDLQRRNSLNKCEIEKLVMLRHLANLIELEWD
ncbi:hypothetical protein GXP67_04120 [Rhodocytophaga rosea]|uniref:Uncharacterized protein n=1 Tax=Rhodocytophaga rosea TaxID=2704465 RepID=A0A6C0GD67_9BACT|nr:hypothetical protein [Rhodocytophaga rosea]QHT65911.1 hypothetical protein GXP67_04120 [Rhodocytophaga rosea]